MKRRAFNILAGLSVALWLVTVVLWLRSYHHSDFVQLFTSEPKLMPMTTTAQAKAWERLRARTGWDGVYTARYMATAFANGNGYFFRGIQSIIVTDRKDRSACAYRSAGTGSTQRKNNGMLRNAYSVRAEPG